MPGLLRAVVLLKPTTRDMLARVAAIYTDAPRTGRHPVDEVARRLGISYEAAKQRIRRARRAGLLPAVTQGR